MKQEKIANNYLVQNYNFNIKQASFNFYIKYYLDEDTEDLQGDIDHYVDIWDYKGVANTVKIGDDFWDINDIMIALEHNIPKDILHSWYSDYIDYHMDNKEEGGFPNLYNYYLKDKKEGKKI